MEPQRCICLQELEIAGTICSHERNATYESPPISNTYVETPTICNVDGNPDSFGAEFFRKELYHPLPDVDSFKLLPFEVDPWMGFDVENLGFGSNFEPPNAGPSMALHVNSVHPLSQLDSLSMSIAQRISPDIMMLDISSAHSIANFVGPIAVSPPQVLLYEQDSPTPSLWSQATSSISSSSQPTPKSRTGSVLSVSTPATGTIIPCSWPGCSKTFFSNSACNHHLKNHTKPFQCPYCQTRQPTKRLIARHVNERHLNTEKYYCTVSGCKRSMGGVEDGTGGKHFTREENCRKHLRLVHGLTPEGDGRREDETVGVDMDELTMRIRRERKMGRRGAGP